MNFQWYPLFSQTGTEILEIIQAVGIEPTAIITNKRPLPLREINKTLLKKYGHKIIEVPNKPTVKDYNKVLGYGEYSIVTLHGWLRQIPEDICKQYSIFNGHPGLISIYPELKGKDPQIRAIEGKYSTVGSVIHKVTPEIDEGAIISEISFETLHLTEDEIWSNFRQKSLYLWVQFFNKLIKTNG
jgi:folate-dependent phosphoribosylglycinamide formyltransferase PurN